MDRQFEKEHVIGGLVMAVVALFLSYELPKWIAAAFGWQEGYQHAYAWVAGQGAWIKAVLIFIYLLAGFFALVVIVSAIGTAGYLLVRGICVATVWLANAVSRLICGATRGVGKALASACQRAARPFVSGRRARRSRGGPRSSGGRKEKSSKSGGSSGTDGGRKEESSRSGGSSGTDSYKEAVRLFGLDQEFDEAGLDSRFRALIKRVHPDVAGPNHLAVELNLARNLIKERRGWR